MIPVQYAYRTTTGEQTVGGTVGVADNQLRHGNIVPTGLTDFEIARKTAQWWKQCGSGTKW